MNYEDLLPLESVRETFEVFPISAPKEVIEGQEETTDVFIGLDFDCQSELNSPSDSDSRQSDSSEKPVRRQLVIGQHIKINEDGLQKFTCTVCNCNFSRKQQVRYHDYCVTGKRPLKCDLCGKGFIKKSHLIYHVRTHTGESPFQCHKCHKGFKQKANLKRHEKTHSRDEHSRLVCLKCSKSFSDKDALKKHEQKHNLNNSYTCSYCKKCYADKFTLKQHMEIHKNPSFICDVCGKTFMRKNSLNVHMQIHDDIYPFECDSCHKTFRSKKELVQHSVVHNKGNAGYECNICSTTCGRKDNLLRHIRNCHLDPCQKKSLQDPLCSIKDKTKTKESKLQEHDETSANKIEENIVENDAGLSPNKDIKENKAAGRKQTKISSKTRQKDNKTRRAGSMKDLVHNTAPPKLIVKLFPPKSHKRKVKSSEKQKVKKQNKNQPTPISRKDNILNVENVVNQCSNNLQSSCTTGEMKSPNFTQNNVDKHLLTTANEEGESSSTFPCVSNQNDNLCKVPGKEEDFTKSSFDTFITDPVIEDDKEKCLSIPKRSSVLVSALSSASDSVNMLEKKQMPSNNVKNASESLFDETSNVENILVSDKCNAEFNLFPQKKSVILHTDTFRALVLEANACREPVIKCTRSSMLGEEIGRRALQLQEPP